MKRGEYMNFFTPDNQYLQQIKEMCMTCFDMDKEEVDFVFDKKYISLEICYAVKQNEKLCSILFTVPCTMLCDKEVKGHYIYGACTLPEYRHQGIMHKLIKYALSESEKKGHVFSALLPANKGLYDFYGELGYRCLFTAYNSFIARDSLPNLIENIPYKIFLDSAIINNTRKNFCQKYIGTVQYNNDIHSYACCYAERYGGGMLSCEKGYILYAYNEDNQMVVLELMCNKCDINIMLGLLKKVCNSSKLYLRLPSWFDNSHIVTDNGENKCGVDTFGMVKILGEEIDTSEFNMPYLGFTFD